MSKNIFPAPDQGRTLPDVGKAVKQSMAVQAAALLREPGAVDAVGRRPIECLQFRKAPGSGQRALRVLAHRAPRRLPVDVPFAPNILPEAGGDFPFRRRRGLEMADIDFQFVKQPVLFGVAGAGQKTVHRWRLGPEIARRAVGGLMLESCEHTFA